MIDGEPTLQTVRRDDERTANDASWRFVAPQRLYFVGLHDPRHVILDTSLAGFTNVEKMRGDPQTPPLAVYDARINLSSRCSSIADLSAVYSATDKCRCAKRCALDKASLFCTDCDDR